MTRCLDWVPKGFGHAQSEIPPEEKARTGLDLFWSSSEDVVLGLNMYLCRLDSGECLTGRQSPVGVISSLPTDLGRFCLLSYKSVSSVASPATSNRDNFPL